MKHFLVSFEHTDSSVVGFISLTGAQIAMLNTRRNRHFQVDDDLAGLLYDDTVPEFFETPDFSFLSAKELTRFDEEGWIALRSSPATTIWGNPITLDGARLVLSKAGIWWFGFSTDNDSNEFFETSIIPYEELFGKDP